MTEGPGEPREGLRADVAKLLADNDFRYWTTHHSSGQRALDLLNRLALAVPEQPGLDVEVRDRVTAQWQAERAFLLMRADDAGRVDFTAGRWTGRSSNALVRFAFGGVPPADSEFPGDASDLAACELTVKRLPEHLKGPVVGWLDIFAASLTRLSDTPGGWDR